MSGTLARRSSLIAVGGVVVALATAWGTAVVAVHLEAAHGNDLAMVSAARALGGDTPGLRDATVWRYEAGEDPVLDRLAETARATGEPAFGFAPDGRILAYPSSTGVIAVRSPAGYFDDDAKRLLAFQAIFCVFVGIGVGLAQVIGVSAALRPLDRAGETLDQITRLGATRPLPEEGPAEVRRLLVHVNNLLRRLDEAFVAQGAFVAAAAHELRTPVTLLLGEIELARRSDPSPTLEHLHQDARRLADLIESLLVLARVDAGQAERARESERASAIAHGALRREAPSLAGVDLRVEIADDPELLTNVGLVETALGNLLRNAALHAPGQPVRLEVKRVGAEVEFAVDDGGPGLSAADRERLFERFARGSRTVPGSGLGLAIAREVARRHGGDARLEPSSRGGCRAVISLPVLRDL